MQSALVAAIAYAKTYPKTGFNLMMLSPITKKLVGKLFPWRYRMKINAAAKIRYFV
jgi:hypothetical protein